MTSKWVHDVAQKGNWKFTCFPFSPIFEARGSWQSFWWARACCLVMRELTHVTCGNHREFLFENSEKRLIEPRVRWSVVEHEAPSLSDLSQLLTHFMSLCKSLNPSVSVLLLVKWKEGPHFLDLIKRDIITFWQREEINSFGHWRQFWRGDATIFWDDGIFEINKWTVKATICENRVNPLNSKKHLLRSYYILDTFQFTLTWLSNPPSSAGWQLVLSCLWFYE